MYIYIVIRGAKHEEETAVAYFSSQTQAKEYAAMLFDLEKLKQGKRKSYITKWYGGGDWIETGAGYSNGTDYIYVESATLDDPELLTKLQKSIREATHELP